LQLRGDLARSRENCPSFPWLALLVSAGLRRVASLVERFGGGGPVPRVQMPHLRDVHVVEDTLRVVQTTRYTQRQEKRVPIEGWTGEVQLTGESVDAIVPLLRAMEVTGVGKGTTMGLGALGVETRP
jgi:CRISPR/Cas system endoribonuclease Cas6 (RAMP superfamily)